jgi:glycosyltransferase involved in cell wall biosynthesis
MIWFDVTDIAWFLASEPSVTGIQRSGLDLVTAICDRDSNSRLCAFCEKDRVFKVVDRAELLASAARSSIRQGRYPAIKARIIKTTVSLVPKSLRKNFAPPKTRRMAIELSTARKAEFRAGDVFVLLGAFWQDWDHFDRMRTAVFVNDMKFAFMIHDLIPITHPHWFSQRHVSLWSSTLKDMLRITDFIFTNSHFTADEVREFAKDNSIEIGPITPLRFGDPVFAQVAETAKPDTAGNLQYRGSNFVLMVSSFEIRKNHKFLLPIWRRLLRELGRENTPDLVLIGKSAGSEFQALLDDNPELKGKIVILNRVSDEQLAAYYRRSLFTVLPSLAEGWGFPIAESLSFGKVCVTSNIGGIPEVGGDLVSYYADTDLKSAYDLIRNLIIDPAERARLESRIAIEYRRSEWGTAAEVVLTTLEKTAATS